ncbi:hypothetical protein RB195_019778 [Necator americanus]|uniref:Uncharacterized protein n=1 Tax=Necator americanus TaxID=51031 RepID=A0ABR1CHB5_NECAM
MVEVGAVQVSKQESYLEAPNSVGPRIPKGGILASKTYHKDWSPIVFSHRSKVPRGFSRLLRLSPHAPQTHKWLQYEELKYWRELKKKVLGAKTQNTSYMHTNPGIRRFKTTQSAQFERKTNSLNPRNFSLTTSEISI